jgi:hypothetical protein
MYETRCQLCIYFRLKDENMIESKKGKCDFPEAALREEAAEKRKLAQRKKERIRLNDWIIAHD